MMMLVRYQGLTLFNWRKNNLGIVGVVTGQGFKLRMNRLTRRQLIKKISTIKNEVSVLVF